MRYWLFFLLVFFAFSALVFREARSGYQSNTAFAQGAVAEYDVLIEIDGQRPTAEPLEVEEAQEYTLNLCIRNADGASDERDTVEYIWQFNSENYILEQDIIVLPPGVPCVEQNRTIPYLLDNDLTSAAARIRVFQVTDVNSRPAMQPLLFTIIDSGAWAPTPTPTATATATATFTATSTSTATATFTATSTYTSTATATSTPEPTSTNTPVPTATNTPTFTPEPTATNIPKPTATTPPTATFTPTATNTAPPTSTQPPTATYTPVPTATSTSTNTPVPTQTHTSTFTPEPTATSTPEPTEIPEPTSTPEPPATRTPTSTPESVGTPTPTAYELVSTTVKELREALKEGTQTPVPWIEKAEEDDTSIIVHLRSPEGYDTCQHAASRLRALSHAELKILPGEYAAFRTMLDQCEEQPVVILIASSGYRMNEERLPYVPSDLIADTTAQESALENADQLKDNAEAMPEPTPSLVTPSESDADNEEPEMAEAQTPVQAEPQLPENMREGDEPESDLIPDILEPADIEEGLSVALIVQIVAGIVLVLLLVGGGVLFLAKRRQDAI